MTSDVAGLPHHVIGPHILLIMADDLAAPLLALHGGPTIAPTSTGWPSTGHVQLGILEQSAVCTRSFRDDDQPAQLERDPHELVNLVGDADFMAVMADFTRGVLRRWDPDKTDAGVRSKQQDRALINMAMRQGRFSA